MSTDLARRAHAIFKEALDRPPAEREAMVSEACGSDEETASCVRRLLAAAERATRFLESPALAGRHDARAPMPDAVGSYMVVGVLGAGGMATVYEALQENPKRRVALKVMHHGMTHADASIRFRLEAETLARLRHPGIAQIYEAGTAQLGQPAPSPFFAMELIEGAMSLTEHARRHALPLRERLRMFASVCDAVLHGHQQGIIHRDLKPGNVLVGPDGRAKVIDFGIARTIGPRPGAPSEGQVEDVASITRDLDTDKIVGTLNYMSPEQCTDPAHIDVRTDVYSLGVMLYELVTGRLPHDLSRRALPEAVRIIAQDAPPRPSALCRDAAGDLDAVIAKAMEKDPARRYVGAGALAADVRRWLDVRPVEARPASALEQVRKFVRRNPPLAATLGALAVTLAIGALLTGRYAYLATRARDAALDRERELEMVTEFQESLLNDIDVVAMGDSLRASFLEHVERAAPQPGGDATPAAAIVGLSDLAKRVNFTTLAVRSLNESVLQRYTASIRERFADQPRLRARLLQQLASTMNNLGLHTDAEPVIRDALSIRQATLGDDHVDTLQSVHSLGSLLATLGRYDDALPLLLNAYQGRQRVLGPDDMLTLRAGTSLGATHRSKGDLAAAERVCAEVLAAQRRVLGDDDPDTLRSLNNMGVVYAAQKKLDKAEACWRELVERRRRTLGEENPEYLASLGNLGVLLQDLGRLAEARELIEQALAANRRRFGDTHARTLVSMSQLAALLHESGDLDLAESLQRECLQGRRTNLGAEHPATLRSMTALASILATRGGHEEAMGLVSTALDTQRRLLGSDHPDSIESARVLGEVTRASRESGATQPTESD